MKNALRSLPIGFAGFLLIAVGCGPKMPPKTDLNTARDALTKALDAWVAGKSAESLKSLKPGISFRDVHWEQGAKLIGYNIEKAETTGNSCCFMVRLSLMDQEERTIAYIVDAGPVIVIRPEF